MSYTKTTWQDRYTDQEGNVVQQGTPVNAANLNKLEQGVYDAHEKLGRRECGFISVTVPAGSNVTGAYTYPEAFSNADGVPVVLAQPLYYANPGVVTAQVLNCYQSGFQYRVANASGAEISCRLMWLAMTRTSPDSAAALS